MSVVLRCPDCGTSTSASGECEACHQAQVRYFCTNHTPGLWLDASTCPSCGARFGDPARGPSRPAPAVSRRTDSPASASAIPTPARPPASARSPASTSESTSPYSRARPARDGGGSWSSRRRARPGEDELAPVTSPAALLLKVLKAAVRASAARRDMAAGREAPRIARRAGGCLMRVALVLVLLFVALASALFLFGRALLPAH